VAPPADRSESAIGIWPAPSRLPEPHRAAAAKLAALAGTTRPALVWTQAERATGPIRKPAAGSETCHGGLLFATGQLDAFLLLGAGPWDITAPIPIVGEAGGIHPDLTVSLDADTNAALFSTIGLHEQILDTLRSGG
jgi:histidinol-phosphatase